MQVQLSVVIITFNEEKNIKRCLDSVVGIADDIVVVDSFSTDNTKQICESYPQMNFIQTEWKGYSATKNYANQQAKHIYILSLDADEVVSSKLKESVQQLSALEGVYEFNRLTNYCGKWIKHCGWYPDKKVRIFPKDKVSWKGDYVHETLNIPKTMSTNFLKGDLMHYSFYTVEEHLQQIEKYATLKAQQMFDKGKRPNFIDVFVSPMFKFLKTFLFKLGVLDGRYGYIICKNSAYAQRLKYEKLKALYLKK
ncbi:MAG: glycosyltransferase family 2 protein [Vicingus serpentipes]|nr:glycosyltransferase family 2 protein [Vicingus serpentipes]